MTATLLSSITKSGVKGTMRWMAPELFDYDDGPTSIHDGIHNNPNLENLKPTRDIYAYACTVYEILAGKLPFANLSDVQVMFSVLAGRRPERPTFVNWCPQ
ncbi:hypothetical protein E1B28_012070 [Marasmius oreades]|uniref:Protein kinase domain-containing protein n=1 Tax=Marasmius oreades TaxID=181124 RepID=A0A9P7RQS6_9AGAR|nr:uncharacterized protein E1B28_012070 [Marasmius oreades]KAG7088034.1 hypothetical protein E1B28_012070 [Marasmius oreades]